MECGPEGESSSKCSRQPAMFRCLDCLCRSPACQDCCLESHQAQPFHRIQRWAGQCWEAGDLDDLGLVLCLGHWGHPCPCPAVSQEYSFDPHSDSEDEETAQLLGTSNPPPAIRGADETRMVFITSTGVYSRTVSWCYCPRAPTRDMQLFKMNLFSASFLKPGTAFTFDVLDHFHMDAMECKTSASAFFSKLKHFTNNAFPHTVPVKRPPSASENNTNPYV